MKKSMLFLALLCALLTSCKKECEEDNTTTVKITNNGTLRAYVNINGDTPIEPGETKIYEESISDLFGVEATSLQSVIHYRWEGSPEDYSLAGNFNQCETTEFEITD